MRFSKKFTLLLPTLLTIVVLLVSACGGGGTTPGGPSAGQPASADKQIFRYPIGATDFSTLDPALVQAATDAYAIQTIFTGLVQFNDKGEVIDQLAASHSVSSDGLTYTFKLRPNLKFSDGTALTSKDVVYGINRTMLPATKSQVSYYIQLIKDYDKITAGKVTTLIGDSLLTPDDSTVVIVISKPAAYFLQAMTYPVTYVVEKSLIDKYGATWTDHLDQGGGAGPFKVQSYSHTKGAIEVPNPNYYGPQPKIQKLEFLQSGDTNTTYKAYQSGQFDYASVPPALLAQTRAGTHKSELHDFPLLVIRYLALNYLSKPFDNIKIRQAFALALDKDLLASSILRGAVKATNHIVPEGMVGYNANLTGPAGVSSTKGDKNMAKQLLQQGMQEAGYTTLPSVTFTYYTDNSAIPPLAQAIVQQWQTALGVTVKTQAILFDKLIQLEGSTTGHAGPLQMWIIGWQADYPDPQDWLTIFFGKGADYNNFNYGQNNSSDATQQQTVQQQLSQADVTQDPNARVQAYNNAEQQIINDVGWIPLYQSEGHVLLNPKLANYTFDALDITAPNDWGTIFISQ